jgi:hypothetical protein
MDAFLFDKGPSQAPSPAELLVTASDDHGRAIKDFKPDIEYESDLNLYPGTADFYRPGAGDYFLNLVVPNEPFALSVEAAGFETATQNLRLAEGETRRLNIRLRPLNSGASGAENIRQTEPTGK